MRDIRDLILWSLGWAAFALLGSSSTLSPQGNPIVFLGGGIVAGALILLPRRRWWPVLVATVLGLGLLGWQQGWNWDVIAVRSLAAALAVTVYAASISRHREEESALGASLGWVVRAAVRAVIVILIPVAVLALAEDGAEAETARHAVGELGFSTAAGLLLGSGCVIAVSRSRRSDWPVRTRWAFALLGIGTAASLAVGYLSPISKQFPAVQFAPYIFLFIAATTLPFVATALLVTFTCLAIAVSAAREIGPYTGLPADDTTSIVSVQVLILFITVAFYSLAYMVTERRRAQETAEAAAALMTATFAQSPTAALLVDLDADGLPVTVRRSNPALEALVGHPVPAGARLEDVLVPVDGPRSAPLGEGGDMRIRSVDGQTHWLRTTLSDPLTAAGGSGDYAVLSVEDVSADRMSEELLRQQARRDSLTGLPNRQALIERLDEALSSAETHDPVALVIVDIDGLHAVNEGRGHDVGDSVVVEVSRRLSAGIGAPATLARLGGDEFAVIRAGLDGEHALAHAGALQALATGPMALDGADLSLSLSAGVAVAEAADVGPLDLLRRADMALARAKRSGRGGLVLFEPGDDQSAVDRVGIEKDLRYALDDRTLVCMLQPVVRADTHEIVAAETLVRLRGVDGALVPPTAFLPLAYDLGLMGPLTVQVLERACEAVGALRDAGRPLRVSFNAPPHWLSPGTASTIVTTVQRYSLPPGSITVEVTEDETLSAGPSAMDALVLLRDAGIHVAIDDFGTGYAGLDTFRTLPADVVKIDRTFVADMLRSSEDSALVRAMIDLIHRFGRMAVAEGVETAEQADALADLGCDLLQGFHFGRPVLLEDFPAGPVLP